MLWEDYSCGGAFAMRNLKKFGHWYLLGLLILGAFFVWSEIFFLEAQRGRLLLHVFDVGQGDAIFIRAPNGNQVLIDGGPDTTVLTKLGQTLPWWDRSIDLLLLTHPHADHLDGLLEVLERYAVGRVVESGVNHSIPEYQIWHDAIAARHIPVAMARNGVVIHLGAETSIKVLAPLGSFLDASPRNIHAASVVGELAFASSTVLFMADAEAALERELIRRGEIRPVDVLKVGHHGSKTSTSEALLGASRPRLAVISVGRKNRYGHPTQEVLDRLERFGIQTYRTDQDGDVVLVSNGRTFAPLLPEATVFRRGRQAD